MILREPTEIDRYLRELRERDRAATGADAAAFTRTLEAHVVVMDHGTGDEVEESLATWLSALDDALWRERVREVRHAAPA
ncbi:MAG TPA: hypothetical protein VFG42_11125 [Baekduia sp.]|uniref:hypothetical protein n=1 Tax=Baekduia sp. TaxID=2600305 RepID=UPI002D7927D6|nr:hypothetical protein [Baekduia sp.]HET6507330.1 hypothetical protein [Baekduia sp.]